VSASLPCVLFPTSQKGWGTGSQRGGGAFAQHRARTTLSAATGGAVDTVGGASAWDELDDGETPACVANASGSGVVPTTGKIDGPHTPPPHLHTRARAFESPQLAANSARVRMLYFHISAMFVWASG
jgi:hypothetical protein